MGQGPGLQCPEAKGQWGLVSGSLGSTEPLEFAQLQWPWSPGVKAPWELGTDRETLQGSCPKPGSSQASQLPLVAGQAVCLEVGQAPCSAEGRTLTPPAPCSLSWPAEAGRIVRLAAAAHEGSRGCRLPAGGARLTTGRRDGIIPGRAVTPAPPSSLLWGCVPGSGHGLCTGPRSVLVGPGKQGWLRDASRKAGLSPQCPAWLREPWAAWLCDHVPNNVLSMFWPPLAWHSPTLRGTCLEKVPPGFQQSQQPSSVCCQPTHTCSPYPLRQRQARNPRKRRAGLLALTAGGCVGFEA